MTLASLELTYSMQVLKSVAQIAFSIVHGAGILEAIRARVVGLACESIANCHRNMTKPTATARHFIGFATN